MVPDGSVSVVVRDINGHGVCMAIVQTDGGGFCYTVPNGYGYMDHLAGTFTMTVQKDGYTTLTRTGIEITELQNIDIADLVLLGNVETAANNPQIAAEEAAAEAKAILLQSTIYAGECIGGQCATPRQGGGGGGGTGDIIINGIAPAGYAGEASGGLCGTPNQSGGGGGDQSSILMVYQNINGPTAWVITQLGQTLEKFWNDECWEKYNITPGAPLFISGPVTGWGGEATWTNLKLFLVGGDPFGPYVEGKYTLIKVSDTLSRPATGTLSVDCVPGFGFYQVTWDSDGGN